MYWAEWGNSGSIERALLDGTQRQAVVTHIGKANSLTIEHAARKLYWTDLSTPAIVRYDLPTRRKETIVSRDIPYPFSVTQYRDYIYWSDWNTGHIERADKNTGANRTKIHDRLDSVTDLKVFHASRQAGWNPCAIVNGNCSHICIALPGSNGNTSVTHRCACPTHYSLSHDNRTCTAPRHFMIYSLRNVIARYLPDQENDCPDVVLRVPGLKNVRAIEFDPVTQHIYWIDGRTMTIRRTPENRTQQQHNSMVVVSFSSTGHPFDLALDPLGRLLFWTCVINDVVNVTRLDNGSALGVVVKADGEKPRNIAVHSRLRLLFWTDAGKKMRVMRSKMDGKERHLIAGDLPEQPIGLAVDTATDTVYWAYGRQIERSDFHGGNRKILVTSVTQQSSSVYLAVFFDHLYWYDRDAQVSDNTVI